jgi:hypothetical protein
LAALGESRDVLWERADELSGVSVLFERDESEKTRRNRQEESGSEFRLQLLD